MPKKLIGDEIQTLEGVKGEIVEVKLQDGHVSGYIMAVDGEEVFVDVQEAMVGKKIVEDVEIQTARLSEVKNALHHWRVQRDFHGPSWDGIEKFHFDLAKVAPRAAIEMSYSPQRGIHAPWYTYPSSARSDMDGKDWRLVVPGPIRVNCHSLLHGGLWTLSTTVIRGDDEINVQGLKWVGDSDHWKRSMEWSIAVAEGLAVQGYRYDEVIEGMKSRLVEVDRLHELRAKLQPKIEEAANRAITHDLTILLGRWNVAVGSIGSYRVPKDGIGWGILSVDPAALKDFEYLEFVILHELIHAALGENCESHTHGENFQKVAERVGLPKAYRR